MSIFSDFKRQLGSMLGGNDRPRPSATRPSPSAVADAADDAVLVFDPAEPTDAPFLDDPGDDVADYPNDRRRSSRRNARAGTRVLLIDDSATIVALLRKFLRQNGYDTLEAGDAETGIELARSQLPDLIFLDIVLPGMNGFAALRALRRDRLTKTIPIIMISGNIAATEQFYVQRIGADDFMKKPFSRDEVFRRIEPLLDAHDVPRRAAERDVATIGADDTAPAG